MFAVRALKGAQAAADELQRTVRTANRQREAEPPTAAAATIPPTEAKLLTRAVAHLRTTVVSEPVWQSLPMPTKTAAAGEPGSLQRHEILSLPNGAYRIRDPALNRAAATVEDSLQVCSHAPHLHVCVTSNCNLPQVAVVVRAMRRYQAFDCVHQVQVYCVLCETRCRDHTLNLHDHGCARAASELCRPTMGEHCSSSDVVQATCAGCGSPPLNTCTTASAIQITADHQ